MKLSLLLALALKSEARASSSAAAARRESPELHMAELSTLLEFSGLLHLYTSLHADWMPYIRELLADFIGHVQIIQGPKLEDTVMKYHPLGSSTHLQLTMEGVTRYFALPTEGFCEDHDDYDDQAQGPEATEPFAPLGSAAEQSLYWFVFHTIVFSDSQDMHNSRDARTGMRHLVANLKGKRVAWGRLLWRYLVKRILSLQQRPGDPGDFFEKLTSTRLPFACTLGALLRQANLIRIVVPGRITAESLPTEEESQSESDDDDDHLGETDLVKSVRRFDFSQWTIPDSARPHSGRAISDQSDGGDAESSSKRRKAD